MTQIEEARSPLETVFFEISRKTEQYEQIDFVTLSTHNIVHLVIILVYLENKIIILAGRMDFANIL